MDGYEFRIVVRAWCEFWIEVRRDWRDILGGGEYSFRQKGLYFAHEVHQCLNRNSHRNRFIAPAQNTYDLFGFPINDDAPACTSYPNRLTGQLVVKGEEA